MLVAEKPDADQPRLLEMLRGTNADFCLHRFMYDNKWTNFRVWNARTDRSRRVVNDTV